MIVKFMIKSKRLFYNLIINNKMRVKIIKKFKTLNFLFRYLLDYI